MIYCEDCSSYECGCPERKEIELLRQHVTLLRSALKHMRSEYERYACAACDEADEALAATKPK